MAVLFKIGKVKSVSSAFTGSLDLEGVGVVSYTDGTLVIRALNLALGELVVCFYDNTAFFTNCFNITPVDAFQASILAQLNSGNSLTAQSIKQKLQIANACASKKGTQYFDGLKKGNDCPELLEQAEMMTSLIDAICGIVPEGEIIGGRQAMYEFRIDNVNGITPKVITVTIGTVVYSLNSNSTTISGVAADIAAYINSFYPQSYSYSAISSGGNVVVAGSDFDADNGTAVSATITNGSYDTFPLPQELAGGIASVIQGENAITNNDIQIILTRLCKLCSIPCEDVVNF